MSIAGRYPEPPPYELKDGASWNLAGNRPPSFVAGEELADLAAIHPEIVVLTADLKHSNRLVEFAERFPDRTFNVGIAEQNMISIAAGMASCGKLPYIGTFAAYVGLLGAEQLRTDVAYPHQRVRVLAHHSGITMGFYGTSHHALEDIAIVRSIADLPCVSATDANMLRAILRFSVGYDGPLYIRMGRGRDPDVYSDVPQFELGRSWRLVEGDDLTMIATGSEVAPAVEAAELLHAKGISTRVVDMVSLSPLDVDAVLAAAGETGGILTVEEHNITGGLGSAVAEVLAEYRLAIPFARHGIHDEFVIVGPPAALYAHYKLDGPGIAGIAEALTN